MSHIQGRVCSIFHFNWLRPIGVALLVAGMAQAVSITVPCSGSGGGAGGLAAAINTGNSTPGPNTINLTPGCIYTLTRTYRAGSPNGMPPITGIITINGYGATIGRSQVSGTPAFRLFDVASGGNLTLNVITVKGGLANNPSQIEDADIFTGGGLSVEAGGKLTLNHSVVTQNRAHAGGGPIGDSGHGGGIYNSGTVILNYSVVSNNTASTGSELGSGRGGGIYNRGQLTLRFSTVTHNTAFANSLDTSSAAAGGIFSAAGRLIMRYSVVSYNTANASPEGGGQSNGGGIVVKPGSTAIVAYSVIRNNIATTNIGYAWGGGIKVDGTATLYRSAIFSNTATSNGTYYNEPNAAGGGLAISACVWDFATSTCSTGKAKLYHVAIYGNSTHAPSGLARGGGIEAGGPATLNYSKVVNNTAAGATLSDSLGGGIFNSNSASGAVILTGTTVADNHPDQCDPTGSVPGCSN